MCNVAGVSVQGHMREREREMSYMYIWSNLYVAYWKAFFVAGSYMAVACKVDVAVGCILAQIYKNAGSYSIIAVCTLYLQCGSHICSVTCQICVERHGHRGLIWNTIKTIIYGNWTLWDWNIIMKWKNL